MKAPIRMTHQLTLKGDFEMNNENIVIIKNARLLFRNFAGLPTRYCKEGGKRTFNVVLQPELAAEMEADGWKIRYLDPRDPDENPTPILEVAVNFGGFKPPRVVKICGGRKEILDETSVRELDYAEIERADVSIRPYNWNVNGTTGIKAYLKSLYVTLYQDELEEDYDELPFI